MRIDKWLDKEIEEVTQEIFQTKDIEALKKLLNNLLTKREMNDMARRYAVLKKIKEGKSYSEIRQDLGVSCSLIARVSVGIGYGFRRTTPEAENRTDSYKEKPRMRRIKYKGMTVLKVPR